ncbi:MAG TPA: methyltransferase domain-containing protein [Syntrophobacter fumaroxidans]|nr:methyltransferase domain-containing protein [Syntrophobacter fumaroxidans]
MAQCRICGNSQGNTHYTAREMMYGSRDEFEYFECGNCGCLQIMAIPDDLQKYYSTQYYSFKNQPLAPRTILQKIYNNVKNQRVKCLVRNWKALGTLSFMIYGKPIPVWLKRMDISYSSHIVDIGCGSGSILLSLQKSGYTNLVGIDPFINDSIIYNERLKIIKQQLCELDGKYDLIMMHHSLEHIDNHTYIFKILRSLLNPGGTILIRTPIVSSFAWRKYKINWVQMDSPRHLYLHTVKSMKLLADQSSLKIVDIYFDSTAFQFWGSEQYINDIPLLDMKSYRNNPRGSIFTDNLIKEFERKSRELNASGDGDQACFYLKAV